MVDFNDSLPEILRRDKCGIKAKRTTLVDVDKTMIVQFDLIANDSVGIDSTYYEWWTFNTAYTTNGTARPDTLQDGAPWQSLRSVWTPEHGKSWSEFAIAMDVKIGWPIIGTTREVDSLHFKFRTPTSHPDSVYGDKNGVFYVWHRVRNGVTTPWVQHPSALHAGTSASWNLIPADDTGGYDIDWYWDSALQTSFENKYTFTKTMPVAGWHTLGVDVTLYDTTFNFSYNIQVPVDVSIAGDAIVSNSVTNTYSVSYSGGTAPYSVQWYIDGSPYSTSNSFDAPYWALYSDHHLEVTVTDANSEVGYAELWVFVSSCDPQDPNCQISLRASPVAKKQPAARTPTPRSQWPTVRGTRNPR